MEDIRANNKGVKMYQPIDQIKTGKKMKIMLESRGYSVKFIQEYLHLSCPQSIYRWYKGKVLPSLEHLAALSRLLHIHMEELLVFQGDAVSFGAAISKNEPQVRRVIAYVTKLQKVA